MVAEEWQIRLAERWRRIVEEVAEAAVSAGRSPAAVRIVGVTKYVDATVTRELVNCGCLDLGEARPQQLVDKAEALSDLVPVRWHLIGSLQRNKARRVVRVAHTIHSIDSEELLGYLDRVAGEEQRPIDGLLEVNISGDVSKHGFTPESLLAAAAACRELANVRVVGLMGMSGLGVDGTEARRQFALLRNLGQRLEQATGRSLPELSMGMSGDYREAIAEGATLVRIGSSLFESLGLPGA